MPPDPDKKDEQEPVRGPIVEDQQMVGGHDKQTGADVIRPKVQQQGKADQLTEATDPRERP